MDIRRWLAETTTPGIPASLGLPAGQHAREAAARDESQQPAHHTRQHPQRLLSSDSSLLQVDRTNGFGQAVTQKAGNGDRALQHTASDKAASRCLSGPSGSADRSESEEPYARRPRRKTRPEIYEPRADKKSRRRRREREQDESRATKRTSRRKAKGRPPDNVHTFHAKNVAQDRLTLKPKDGLGLFKKGRASSPVKGRGLPDLVFSEMRFLQKRSDPTETQPADDAPRKRKKNDDVGREDQISAYFGAKRSALAETEGNAPSKRQQAQLPKSDQRKDQPACQVSASEYSAEQPIELPDRPYLGFGTRGVDPNSSDTTYHIPWSESIRHASDVARRRSSQLQSLSHGIGGHDDARGKVLNEPGKDTRHELQNAAHKTRLDEIPLKSAQNPAGSAERRPSSLNDADLLQEKVQNVPRFQHHSPSVDSQMLPSCHKRRTYTLRHEAIGTALHGEFLLVGTSTPKTNTSGRNEKASTHAGEEQRASASSPKGHEVRRTRVHPRGAASEVYSATEGRTNTRKSRAPPRSSSPLGKLLRQCDDACDGVQPVQNTPILKERSAIDMGHAGRSVNIGHAASQAKAYRAAVPPHWTSDVVPKTGLYQMQMPDEMLLDEWAAGHTVVEELDKPDMAGEGMEGMDSGYVDDVEGVYVARDRSTDAFGTDAFGMDVSGAGWSDGRSADGSRQTVRQHEGQQRETGGSADIFVGFRRPHRLY